VVFSSFVLAIAVHCVEREQIGFVASQQLLVVLLDFVGGPLHFPDSELSHESMKRTPWPVADASSPGTERLSRTRHVKVRRL
jgi:hypothetical protein